MPSIDGRSADSTEASTLIAITSSLLILFLALGFMADASYEDRVARLLAARNARKVASGQVDVCTPPESQTPPLLLPGPLWPQITFSPASRADVSQFLVAGRAVHLDQSSLPTGEFTAASQTSRTLWDGGFVLAKFLEAHASAFRMHFQVILN
jgi:hypothetical protein